MFKTPNDKFIWENWPYGWRKSYEETVKYPSGEVWENFSIAARAYISYVGEDHAELSVVAM